jgi:hypothetical protein
MDNKVGTLALNVNGAVLLNGRLASCGAVLRDDNGNFLCAFASKLRLCIVLEPSFGEFTLV